MSYDEETKDPEEHADAAVPDIDDAFEDDAAVAPEDDLGTIGVPTEEEDDLDEAFYGDERDANY